MSREIVEKVILERLDAIDPSKTNSSIYRESFKKMSNSEFETMMENIRDGKTGTFIIAPNGSDKVKLDLSRNKKLLKKLNIKLFHNLTITNGKEVYKSNIKSLVLRLPIFRMVQTASKKFSVHEHLKSRNTNTGQVSGVSRSGDLTYNETMILKSMGLSNTLNEMLGIRGGDVQGSTIFRAKLFEDGKVSYKDIKPFLTTTGSTSSLHAFFKAAHIGINI